MPEVTWPVVRLIAESGDSINGSLVYIWNRDDCDATAAPTFRTMAAALFDAVPQAARVALVSTKAGQLLLIVEAAHRWFDVGGKPMRLQLVKPPEADRGANPDPAQSVSPPEGEL